MCNGGGGEPKRSWNICFPTNEHSTWQCLNSRVYMFIKREYVFGNDELLSWGSLSIFMMQWQTQGQLCLIHEWVWTGPVNRHFPGKCVCHYTNVAFWDGRNRVHWFSARIWKLHCLCLIKKTSLSSLGNVRRVVCWFYTCTALHHIRTQTLRFIYNGIKSGRSPAAVRSRTLVLFS